ncbi:eukaryotic translation initiation factor 4 gamma 1-like [Sipha flava]|uniref:Eukaryotic translation initiation factor 4 gamma 1-like n=2 Tax=Sipha flava TaxID=143950 RepID=A0A8B8GE54_9HEMI|nr:eukaryotic translation initiation factor 4 gamma 1-like [Sipha flava]
MYSKFVKTNDFKVVNIKAKTMYSKEMLIRLKEQPICWKEPASIEKLVEFRILRPMAYGRAPTREFVPRTFDSRSRVETARRRVVHYQIPKGDASDLKTCSNPWTPSCLKGKRAHCQTSNYDEAQTEEIEKKFRSILNKITPENMVPLTNSILSLSINTDHRLKKVIDILFQKAINEPHFTPQYAYICMEMNNKDINAKVKTTTSSFKTLIILCCEDRFNSMHVHEQELTKSLKEIKDCKDQDDKEKMQSKYDRDEKIHRERSVGNCRFMCELYKVKILSNQTLEMCIKHLLMSPKEETLECACNILKQIGKTLNHKVTFEVLNEYMSLAYKTKIPTRIRFMILDTIELKDNNWIPRKHRTVQKSCDTKTPENNHSETVKYTSMLSMNYGPPKNDGHIDTSDSSRPLLSTRTSDVVAHEVSPMSLCFKTETKNY